MQLSQLISRYSLSCSDLDLIVTCIKNDLTLTESEKVIKKLNAKQIFTICKAYCEEELGEDVITSAPRMTEERKQMLKEKEPDIIAERARRKIAKEIMESQADLADFIREQRAKIGEY